MSDQEILEKAIQKAIDGGWDSDGWEPKYLADSIVRGSEQSNLYELIFDHSFARALWGDGLHKVTATYRGQPIGKMSWQYHLMHMVLADDPIKYLAENI